MRRGLGSWVSGNNCIIYGQWEMMMAKAKLGGGGGVLNRVELINAFDTNERPCKSFAHCQMYKY